MAGSYQFFGLLNKSQGYPKKAPGLKLPFDLPWVQGLLGETMFPRAAILQFWRLASPGKRCSHLLPQDMNQITIGPENMNYQASIPNIANHVSKFAG